LPVVLCLAAAGLLVLGGGIALAVILVGNTKETKQQAGKTKERDKDDGDDDNKDDDAVKGRGDGLVADDGRTRKKPRKKTDKPVIRPKPVDPAVLAKQKKVNAAIDRGIAYLKATLTINEPGADPTSANNFLFQNFNVNAASIGIPVSHPGIPPLIGLTLMACGVSAKDPVVQKAAALTRTAGLKLTHCYSLAIAILFLDALGEKDRDLIQKMALQLVAGQTHSGGWGYNCRQLSATDQANLLAFLRNPGQPAALNLRQLAVVEYKAGQKMANRLGEMDDNSNTQFASLALWAARKHGIPMERTLGLVDTHFRGNQTGDGSWTYATWIPRCPLRHPTTCAGLIGLAVGRGAGAQTKLKLSEDEAVKKGLEFLGKIIGAPLLAANAPAPTVMNPKGRYFGADAMGDLYFLWSIERVAVIYKLDKIGGKDWYGWGSDIILAKQNANGSWTEWYPGVPDTCFALLFLKRANVVKDLTSKLQKLEAVK
jgi:hypothetical protein